MRHNQPPVHIYAADLYCLHPDGKTARCLEAVAMDSEAVDVCRKIYRMNHRKR